MFSTYSELKEAIVEWMVRSDLSGSTSTMIALAESKLNREIGAIVEDATLTGTIGSRVLDISSLDVAKPLGLFVTLDNTDKEKPLHNEPSFAPRNSENAEPVYYTVQNDEILLDSPCDKAYSFRFSYAQKLALSDANPANWLLTNHPDVYFHAAMVWGGLYIKDQAQAALYKGALDEAIREVNSILSKRRRSLLQVDQALSSIGGRNDCIW